MSLSGLVFSIFFAFGVAVKPLAGGAYDRVGIRKALVFVLVGPIAPVSQLFQRKVI